MPIRERIPAAQEATTNAVTLTAVELAAFLRLGGFG